MANQPEEQSDAQASAVQDADQPVSLKQRVSNRIASMVRWGVASKLRMGITATVALASFGATFAVWSYLAHLAVDAQPAVTIEMALAALDQQDTEKARTIVGELQRQAYDASYFGGALFVLGACKEYDAEKEWSTDRRRAIHLVAARYLQKAQALGLPPNREEQFTYLLGRSLVLGNQPQDGIPYLEKSLLQQRQISEQPGQEKHSRIEILSLLAKAHLALPNPDLEAAFKHNTNLLSYKFLSPELRGRSQLIQADILGRMGQLLEATKMLASISDQHDLEAQKKLLVGHLAVMEASSHSLAAPQQLHLISHARANLREAQQLDPANGSISRNAMYWIGQCYALQEEHDAAADQYDKIIQLYGDTPEGLAATLAKADIDRNEGNIERALVGYRTILNMIGNPALYSNHLVPLKELRKRFTETYHYLLEHQQFEQVRILVDQFEPLFSKVDTQHMVANIHQQWGEKKLADAASSQPWKSAKPTSEGRYHFRAAAVAHEGVARLRRATNNFTDDLWQAAEYYFRGHNFTHAVRVYKEYLHHEAMYQNSHALLRLGQALISLDQTDEAISTLTDCIDLYPKSDVTYQARIDCARAHIEEGQNAEAESLLLINLTGDTLHPRSLEWRDSLFLLGTLLHNTEHYLEAIDKLEEAILRYPDAPQSLLSRYMIARSFHLASENPKKNLADAKTENERNKNRTDLENYLAQALDHYQKVQEAITQGQHSMDDELGRSLLRNCYKMQGSVLFQLKRYDESRKAYANISTLYQHEPFVLESFVQIAYCWRRLNQPVKARQTIEQAKLVLNRLPAETDFKLATNLNRQGWQLLLNQMGRW